MGGYDPEVHHRRSVRLKTYDYSLPGPYFVTICVEHRVCVLGAVDGDVMALSATGMIVAHELTRIQERSPWASVDASIVMPNHIHAIIGIEHSTGDSSDHHPLRTFKRPGAGTLGEVVRAFKAASARAVRRDYDVGFAWQDNYHERVIRNDRELKIFYEYIQTNPARWSSDVFFAADEQADLGRVER
jgi:REP element-mobilizing transposase RayT